MIRKRLNGDANPDNALKLVTAHKLCCGNEAGKLCIYVGEYDITSTGALKQATGINLGGVDYDFGTIILIDDSGIPLLKEAIKLKVLDAGYSEGTLKVKKVGDIIKLRSDESELPFVKLYDKSVTPNIEFALNGLCLNTNVCEFKVSYKPGKNPDRISFDGGETFVNLPSHTFGTTTEATVTSDVDGLIPSTSALSVESVTSDATLQLYDITFKGEQGQKIVIDSTIGEKTATECNCKVGYIEEPAAPK